MVRAVKLKEMSLKGQRVLLRVDFNVPLDDTQSITDDTRIQAALPTIQYLMEGGAKVILMSHLGRPKGERNEKCSLKPCAKRLGELIGKEVAMAPDCVGDEVTALVNGMGDGDLLLLENLRFYPGETKPDEHPEFVNSLAKLGTAYVNDAFGTAHRKHASTYAVPKLFPEKRCLGFLMEKEVEMLSSLLQDPQVPFYAVIGGSKVSSKIGVIQSLTNRANGIFIGGGMVFTFFKALGYEIGDSLVEEDKVDVAKAILNSCKTRKVALYLPEDIVIANDISDKASTKVVAAEAGIPKGYKGVDIGPKTIKNWSKLLIDAKTIFWNGPVGIFEIAPFAKGTNALAHTIADTHAITIAGGGDCVAAINQAGVSEKFTHISTGGGASLEYIELGHLPGIDIIVN